MSQKPVIHDIGPKPNAFDIENATKDNLNFVQDVEDGWCITVPAGTWHDVINTGSEPMRLYAIYAPVHHAAGKVHGTFDDAERDEDSGGDEPPAWSVQPPSTQRDKHA